MFSFGEKVYILDNLEHLFFTLFPPFLNRLHSFNENLYSLQFGSQMDSTISCIFSDEKMQEIVEERKGENYDFVFLWLHFKIEILF